MPRKKKIEGKNIKDKNKEQVLDKLDKLDFKLNLNPEKSEELEDEEESELEEDVDDSNLNLQSLEFHQFMELSENSDSRAPVLERMALSAPRPIFVGEISQGFAGSSKEGSGREFKYVSGNADANEPKYLSEPGINSPERIDFSRAGRTDITRDSFKEELNQERFFMQSEPRIESSIVERFERPQRFDVERAGKRDSTGRIESEMQKYRPKIPKS
ncbi:MAG: hypothetical protein AABX79_03095 [Nanoarchaeota archaeon]